MATADEFDRDFDAYLQELPHLLKSDLGRFALVGRAELVQTYDSYDEAMDAGYQRFGTRGFLVQKVSQDELALETDQQACRS